MIYMIAAIDSKRGLAKKQRIPWKLPTDQRFYYDMTIGKPALMGWNTFAAMHSRTLPNTPTYVLTGRPVNAPGATGVTDPKAVLREFKHRDLWIHGGGKVFAELLPYADRLYLTRVEGDFACDVFFPEFERLFHRVEQGETITENGISYRIETWDRNGPDKAAKPS